jgi:hypothetical protein
MDDSPEESERSSGPHSLACTGFLTGVAPFRSEGELRAGVSVDQRAARLSADDTWLSSIELACEEQVFGIDREAGYSTAYMNHLSWRTPGTPMPAETNPGEAFARLFRDGGSSWGRTSLAQSFSQSIVDRTRQDSSRLAKELGAADQGLLADYLSNLRQLERRSGDADGRSPGEVAILMFDIVALAFQAGITRVATIMLGREKSRQTFPELDISETHHQLSHSDRTDATAQKLCAIDRYHAQLFAHFAERLNSLNTGQGSVLDSSTLLYGSGLSDGSHHRHDNLPILIIGKRLGPSDSGRHIRLRGNDTLTVLHGSLLESFAGNRRN